MEAALKIQSKSPSKTSVVPPPKMTSKKILALITFVSLLTLLVMVAYMEREYLDKKLLIRYMHGEDYMPLAERFHGIEESPFRCVRREPADLQPLMSFPKNYHCPMEIYVDRRGKLWAMENGVFHRFHRPMGFTQKRPLVIEPKPTPAAIPDGVVQEETRIRVFGNGLSREVIRVRRGHFRLTGKMMSHNRTWPMSSAIGFPVRPPHKRYVILYIPLRSREVLRRFAHPERHHWSKSLSVDRPRFQVVGNGTWIKARLPIWQRPPTVPLCSWRDGQVRPCHSPDVPPYRVIRFGGVAHRSPIWSPICPSESTTVAAEPVPHKCVKKELQDPQPDLKKN